MEELKTISPPKFTPKYLLTVALIITCITVFLEMTIISKMVSSVWIKLKLLLFTAGITSVTSAIYTMLTIIVPPLLFHSESAKLRSFDMFSNYNCVDQNAWIWNLIKKYPHFTFAAFSQVFLAYCKRKKELSQNLSFMAKKGSASV